jgi:hypothetical protein
MDIAIVVPQIFYDLIGRIIPGAMLITIAFLILQGPEEAVKHLATWSNQDNVTGAEIAVNISTTLILLGNLLASYVIGALFGGFWYKFSKTMIGEEQRQRISNVFKSNYEPIKDQYSKIKQGHLDDVALVYDYIQLRFPKAGARIAKLRAEQLMAGSMALGMSVILVVFGFIPFKRYSDCVSMVIEFALGFAIAASVLLAKHLEERTGNAMVNYWLLACCRLSESQHQKESESSNN